jgi:hypothetical protein
MSKSIDEPWSLRPCPVCEHVLSEIALSSQEAGLNEVFDFKVNYVERYDSGTTICNDHLGPHSLEASSIGFCDRCLVLFVRVRRWPGQDRDFEISAGTRVRIVNARLFVGPNTRECNPTFRVISPIKSYGVRHLALETEVGTQQHDGAGDEEDWETEEECEDYMENVSKNPCDNEMQVFFQSSRSSHSLQLHVGTGEAKVSRL